MSVAYDQIRNRVIGFGFGNQGPSDQMLEWDGSTWTDRTTHTGPIARVFAGMIFDPARRRVVMVGGYGTAGPLDDAWEWSGDEWRVIEGGAAPPARAGSVVSIDPDTESVMMFGGVIGSNETAETWLERSEDRALADEVCVAGEDDLDLDGLAGCSDPDCTFVCP